MYHVSDLAAITDAMEEATPRPVREVVQEQYPEATIDSRGRAHAPYEGYEDPTTGVTYRAGEYLPFEGADVENHGRTSVLWVECNGEVYALPGTRGQVNAGRAIAKDQQADKDRNSCFTSTQGNREVFQLTCYEVYATPGYYGIQYNQVLRDDTGHKHLYNGAKVLAEVGQTVTVKATVKAHHTSKDGRRSTILNRPAVQ